MTYTWIKLYHEILDDPKMGRLPNHLWRRTVELFLLAGRQGDDGALPPVEEMAWTLRLDQRKLLEDLHGLAEIGVAHEAQPGRWIVTHFSKRQAALSSTERVQQFRKRVRNEEETNRSRTGNGQETEAVNDSDSSSDSESEGRGGRGEGGVKEAADLATRAQLGAFTGRFGKFHSREEMDGYLALVSEHGMAKLGEVMQWAERKEAHLTNRPALLVTLATAAKGWKGTGSTGTCGRAAGASLLERLAKA